MLCRPTTYNYQLTNNRQYALGPDAEGVFAGGGGAGPQGGWAQRWPRGPGAELRWVSKLLNFMH